MASRQNTHANCLSTSMLDHFVKQQAGNLPHSGISTYSENFAFTHDGLHHTDSINIQIETENLTFLVLIFMSLNANFYQMMYVIQ